jgi:hypothetical protein
MSDQDDINGALETFRLDCGRYPTEEEKTREKNP